MFVLRRHPALQHTHFSQLWFALWSRLSIVAVVTWKYPVARQQLHRLLTLCFNLVPVAGSFKLRFKDMKINTKHHWFCCCETISVSFKKQKNKDCFFSCFIVKMKSFIRVYRWWNLQILMIFFRYRGQTSSKTVRWCLRRITQCGIVCIRGHL